MQRKAYAALFLAGAAAAGLQLNWMPEAAFGRGFEPLNVAQALARGEGHANPYNALPTGPTAHTAPLYPFLLSLGIRALGYTPAFAITATVLHLLLHGWLVAVLPAFSLRRLGHAAPGVWAALCLILLPLLPVAPQVETSLLLAALLAYLLWLDRAAPRGVAAGVIFHLSPSALFLLAPDAARRGRQFPLWLAAAALVCLPWCLRNWAVLGAPSFIRNNLPLELRLSNNDRASAVMLEHKEVLLDSHPQYSRPEAERVRALGETAYQRANQREFLAWSAAHPAAFLRLTAERAWYFWFPPSPHGWPHRAALAGITLLSLFSLLQLPRPWLWMLLLYPLPYYLVQADARYRYPVLWITLLGAGLTLERLRQAWIQRTQMRGRTGN